MPRFGIPPKNILSGEDIYNEGGITAYMAGLYSQLPMEDFNMSNDGCYNGFYNWNCIIWDMLSTGETVNRNNTGNLYSSKRILEYGL